ncbi:MAG: 6,7-dimethyl-8-ribityllumazine synthase [Dehalococcoidia bacterium]
MPALEVDLDGSGLRICVVVARWNMFVTQKLVDGAKATLAERGVAPGDITIAWVPGSFELPTAAGWAARSGRFDAVICLGAVIRGETSHYELVAGEAAAGIADLGRETGVPVVFGVLTTENAEQALARAGGEHGHKGEEAALTAIEMARLRPLLERGD